MSYISRVTCQVIGSAMAVAVVMNGLMCPAQARADGPKDVMNLPSSFTAVRKGGLTPQGAVAPAEIVTCKYVYVDNPHVSDFLLYKTVNVHALVTCDVPALSYLMSVWLFRNDVSVGIKIPQPKPGIGTQIKWNNATPDCINGNYQGTSVTTIVLGPEFDPPGGSIGQVSNLVPVNNCT